MSSDCPPTLEPLAVVGLGCRFPGGAHDPDAYLAFLRRQGDGVTPQPQERWSVERFHDPDPDAAGPRNHLTQLQRRQLLNPEQCGPAKRFCQIPLYP